MFNSIPTTLAFGYWFVTPEMLTYLNTKDKPEVETEEASHRFLAWNILNIMGYFPLVGIITGLWRREMIEKENNDPRNEHFSMFVKIQIVRSWAETFGVGLLFLVPDIIFTIGRKISSNT